MLTICLISLLAGTAPTGATSTPTYLYDARLVQAAPGKLLDLIDLYKARMAGIRDGGDEPPLWMRHSQGDRWDLLLLFPMGSYAEYYRPERIARRARLEPQEFRERLASDVYWQEDVFVHGPALDDLRKAFAGAGYFHVEMFQALPGRAADLYKEREMENAYLRVLREPDNFIFVRDQGAAWDVFTLGCYRNLKHYAEGSDVQAKDQEAAARAAGFEDAAHIGPYLRTLISSHHDTLAVAIK
ncbi:MAG TPA: hypothetical protein VKJ45_23340 [Blastocatellia bacterium]|nr:hypothetical protein [Blastocatellia bacterium]